MAMMIKQLLIKEILLLDHLFEKIFFLMSEISIQAIILINLLVSFKFIKFCKIHKIHYFIKGANPFKFSYIGLKEEILNSKQVLKAIDEVVSRNPNISLTAAKTHARELLDSMISIPNERIMRGLCYIVQKILKRLYTTVNVIESQIQQVCNL